MRKSGTAKAAASGSKSAGILGAFQEQLENVILVLGIYLFFSAFSYAQEFLYRVVDPVSGNKFRYPIFIVQVICLSNAAISFLVLCVYDSAGKSGGVSEGLLSKLKGIFKHTTAEAFSKLRRAADAKSWTQDASVVKEIFLCSVTYVFSMICTNCALTRVSYPVQILIKSSKCIPVILGGKLFFSRTYTAADYSAVFLTTVSLVVFNLLRPLSSSSNNAQQLISSGGGFLLLAGSLACDSLTGPRQDKLIGATSMSPIYLMCLTNVFGAATALALFPIEGVEPIKFCKENSSVVGRLLLLCVSSTLGQFFIFGSLVKFGSLCLTLITTTRKLLCVILSVLIFKHEISVVQWMCVFTIFASLMARSLCNSRRARYQRAHAR